MNIVLAESAGPWLAPVLTLVGVLIVAGAGIWNRRRGATETKAPSVSEVWAESRLKSKELDGERFWRRFFEDLAHVLGRALISMTARHPAHADEQRAVDKYRQYLESKETP